MKSFPYKTLIWVVLLGFSLWLFREPLSEPFRNMEEIEVLGKFKLKVKSSDLEALKLAEEEYEENVSILKTQIGEQQDKVSKMKEKIDKLLVDVEGCAKAEKAAKKVKEEYLDMSTTSGSILSRAKILNNTKVVRTPIRGN